MDYDGASRRGSASRRTVLAAGLTATLGLGAYRESGSAEGHEAPRSGEPTVRVAPAEPRTVTIERVYSQSRRREVELVTVAPEGVDRRGLPTCLMLHGRWAAARDAVGGLPEWLSPAVAAGTVPPFAFVAVDGGEHSYWHAHPGDDPMGMLLYELPRWLAERGMGDLGGLPFATAGLSMGGFGTLLYARRRHEHGTDLPVASVVSPALMTSWEEARRRETFAGRAEWIALDPIRHTDRLGDVSLGVWSGTEDTFIEGTHRFLRRAETEVVSLTPGGHDHEYFGPATLQAVEFIGKRRPEAVSPDALPATTLPSPGAEPVRSHEPEPLR